MDPFDAKIMIDLQAQVESLRQTVDTLHTKLAEKKEDFRLYAINAGKKLAELEASLASETKQHGECVTDYLAVKERIAVLEAALREACDVAIWMSGSNDFSPGGVAHTGWEKARPRLHAALAALATVPAADPRISAEHPGSLENPQDKDQPKNR
jgi:hypothetical protein